MGFEIYNTAGITKENRVEVALRQVVYFFFKTHIVTEIN